MPPGCRFGSRCSKAKLHGKALQPPPLVEDEHGMCTRGSMNRLPGSGQWRRCCVKRSLWKTYAARGMGRGQKTTAVGGVNIDLVAGKTLGLVGESGSRKDDSGGSFSVSTEPDQVASLSEGESFEKLGKRKLRVLRPKMHGVSEPLWEPEPSTYGWKIS